MPTRYLEQERKKALEASPIYLQLQGNNFQLQHTSNYERFESLRTCCFLLHLVIDSGSAPQQGKVITNEAVIHCSVAFFLL